MVIFKQNLGNWLKSAKKKVLKSSYSEFKDKVKRVWYFLA
jgi:hypothetical protein